MTNEELLLKAAKLALYEFERISYQIKADPQVVDLIRKAVARVERTMGELRKGPR